MLDLPHGLQLLFPARFAFAYEQMSLFRLASLNLHELIKLQNPSLTTRPSLATFMEERLSRVVHAYFVIS
jgi:hypothetical protein